MTNREEHAASMYVVVAVGCDRPRQRLSVEDAAVRALSAEVLGGTIHTGLSGGTMFDRYVEMLARRATS